MPRAKVELTAEQIEERAAKKREYDKAYRERKKLELEQMARKLYEDEELKKEKRKQAAAKAAATRKANKEKLAVVV
jgi:hypothetical protein